MAGFFGLFNSKTKYIDEPDTDNAENGSLEFFLEPDEAKSLGNIEYMRKPSVIKKTFPKSRSQEGGELIQEVSSLDKNKPSEANTTPSPTVKTDKLTESPNQERRRPDDTIDLFRNMARELKK